MTEPIDYAIIGAGLSGLSLATQFKQQFPRLNVVIFEKSKGYGGRIATRRVGQAAFDHGAQFIRRSSDSAKWIDLWKSQNLIGPISSAPTDLFCAHSGMTKLAKFLASELDVSLEHKVTHLKEAKEGWEILCDQRGATFARNVVLTSPLPQSLEILKNSKISFTPQLEEIRYAKAIVILIQTKRDWGVSEVYSEGISDDIFSISNQHLKGTSPTPALTVVMSKTWSENHFNISDEEIKEKAIEVFTSQSPKTEIIDATVKKWRYAEPASGWISYFEEPAPKLFLAGDAFGGPSLLGALRSSEALFAHLTQTLR